MADFDDRQRAEEAKYVRNQYSNFEIEAKRNKLLGFWAAELLGIEAASAEVYAKEVMLSDLEEVGDEDVFRKLRKDFDTKGIDISDSDIRNKMHSLLKEVQELQS